MNSNLNLLFLNAAAQYISSSSLTPNAKTDVSSLKVLQKIAAQFTLGNV
jgi:hypothetical protein